MYWQWQSPIDFCYPFITGNGLSCYCRYVWNYGPQRVNSHIKNNWYFVKTDYIDYFWQNPPRLPFVLITHNADRIIGEQERKYLNCENLQNWFAVNCGIYHPKLHPIPLGIGNAGYAHGNVSTIRTIQQSNIKRQRLFYANYNVKTCPKEREYCLKHTGVPLAQGNGSLFDVGFQPKSFHEYMCDIAASYFVISPKGNGIDCHRHWESLYLGSIPVTIRSQLTDQSRYPMVVLDDWRDFKNFRFTEETFNSLWAKFDKSKLEMSSLLKKISTE